MADCNTTVGRIEGNTEAALWILLSLFQELENKANSLLFHPNRSIQDDLQYKLWQDKLTILPSIASLSKHQTFGKWSFLLVIRVTWLFFNIK